jgi:FtsZ-binding cell division protein ZapB
MFRHLNRWLYAVDADPSGVGGGAAAPGAEAQPVVPGQGPEAPGDDQFWGMFPDVPIEHRELLRPHISVMQGHVTKLEQQLAPFKPFLDAGLEPKAAAGLLNFSQQFDQDPLGSWMNIAKMLQDEGKLDPEVDLEYLDVIARGGNPDEGQPAATTPPVDGVAPETGAMDPQVMQTIAQLQNEVKELRGYNQTQEQKRQEAIQDQLLTQRLGQMRTELTNAGWPEDALSDERLNAEILVHRGNIQAATKAMVDQRSALLKGFVKTNTREVDELDLPNGAPPAPRQKPGQDAWGKARGSAEQRLRMENRAAARQQ